MKTLYDVIEFLNDVDDINCGGCGVAAISIYRWLKKENLLLGNEKFVFLYTEDDDFFINNEQYFKGQTDMALAPAHVVLDIDGIYFDSTGMTRQRLEIRYPNKHDNINENFLLDVLNVKCWNSSFDRNNIPTIARKLEIDLSEIEIDLSYLPDIW